MTDQKRIKVTIDPMGNPKVEAIGFNGVGCQDATAPIEQALGGAVAGRELKSEFYQLTEDTNENEHVRF